MGTNKNLPTFLFGCGVILYVLLLYWIVSVSFRQGDVSSHGRGRLNGKRVLVTGVAGFIGFSVAKRLVLENSDITVVGLDNFNDYYDIQLKIDRAYELSRLGVEVHYEDLCNADFLETLFETHDFTHVVHMAAQAGVRYSLQNPEAYITSNIQCHVTLLDTLIHHKGVKFVYASSSSVYGKKAAIPFRITTNTDQPGNMYAATKKVDELISYQYCTAHNITGVGLRFFTVYGPWGRPDMAVFKFAESILDGTDVPMFHVSDDEPLGRDFTFVDDITQGVLSAMSYQPSYCGEQFNLGFGNPVSVPGLIKFLEEELATPAKVKKLPLPPTEILRTWADIETSAYFLNFRPKTSLRYGVREFVKWYRWYRAHRQSGHSQSNEWFKQLEEKHALRQRRVDRQREKRQAEL